MASIPVDYWKIILGLGIIITVLSLVSLPTLYENISGDNIPNRPQKEPPIEYQWDTAISRILVALISSAISIYAYNKIRKT
jgi:hypothetical protein